MSPLAEEEFESVADEELSRLIEALIDCSEDVDPDLASGVLSINFEDNTKFVVNSHRAARQIWVAAEQSAWHFDYHASTQRWLAAGQGTDQETELWSALSAALSRKLGGAIQLRGDS